MTQYYYLVASLPLLVFAGRPPLRSQEWLDLCREQVAESDHALLSRISIAAPFRRPGDPAAWRTYSSWETALRNELVAQRAQRLGLDPEPFRREAPFFPGLSAFAKEALDAATPKDAETALDRRRWSVLEELEAGTQFDLGRLIVYRLKLMILERRERFRPEPGLESFRSAYARVMEKAAEWTGSDGFPAGHGGAK